MAAFQTEMKSIALDQIEGTKGNPNVMDKKTFEGLVNSMKVKGWYMEKSTLWEYKKGKYRAISGHKRIQAGLEAGIKETIFNVITDKRYNEKQARKDLLEANSRQGKDDRDLLIDFIKDLKTDFSDITPESLAEDVGFSLDYITKIFEKTDEKKTKPVELDAFQLDQAITEKIEKAEKILIAFSGGRDSCLTLVKILPLIKHKDFEAVFVTGAVEFPDLFFFVKDFCEAYNVPLKLLRAKKDFFEYYDRKKAFPDSIYRDCIELFINEPMDTYIKSLGKEVLLIRGGRKKQKTTRSKSDIYQEIKKSESYTVKILNPIFLMKDDEYDREIKKINIWPGYEKGFVRTACWCCPFQKHQQWDTLREVYPGLWEVMRRLSLRWKFPEHEGDSIIKSFNNYWRKHQ